MIGKPHIGVLFSRVRVEEKWIFAALEKRAVDYERLDDRTISFDLEQPQPWQAFDAVLERSISFTSGLNATAIAECFRRPNRKQRGSWPKFAAISWSPRPDWRKPVCLSRT